MGDAIWNFALQAVGTVSGKWAWFPQDSHVEGNPGREGWRNVFSKDGTVLDEYNVSQDRVGDAEGPHILSGWKDPSGDASPMPSVGMWGIGRRRRADAEFSAGTFGQNYQRVRLLSD